MAPPHDSNPIQSLASVINEERERIARLWSKRLIVELNEVEAPSRDLREPLLDLVTELGRLLRDRGEDAVALWAEVVRAHGAARYDLRFEAEDLSRELKVLQQVLLRIYSRRRGRLEPEVAELIAEIIGEADAAAHAAYARILRTEEVRMREAAMMESVLEHIDVGIMLAEDDGRISYATPPVRELLGVPARVLMGANVEALRSILQRLNARHPNGNRFRVSELPLVRALKEKQDIRSVPMIIDRLSDGRQAVLEFSATPVLEEGTNDLYGVVQTFADRTDTTQKAQELAAAYEQLRSLQGRLLQRTRAQALGQLASGAAHNLNNYLNVLRLRMTLLRRGYKPEYLDALDRAVTNIGELVARLQDFANQRSEEELQQVQLPHVIEDALEMVRPELERREPPVQLDARLEGEALGKVDPSALGELLVNLIMSSAARVPEGGTVKVRSHPVNGWFELTVEQPGVTYSQDDLIRLFDPLKGKTPAPQLSLLLAVGRHQVQHWGGELWAENQPDGGGAAFRLRLPIVQEVEAEEQRARKLEVERRRRPQTRRVLVVDDEPENARMMGEVLTDEGYQVGVATSGEEAIRLWHQGKFDAALLDALLPDVSGWSVAREIRKVTPNALVAVVTGADVRGQNRDNLALVDAVFRKPIDVGELDEFLAQTQPTQRPPEGAGARESFEAGEPAAPRPSGPGPGPVIH